MRDIWKFLNILKYWHFTTTNSNKPHWPRQPTRGALASQNSLRESNLKLFYILFSRKREKWIFKFMNCYALTKKLKVFVVDHKVKENKKKFWIMCRLASKKGIPKNILENSRFVSRPVCLFLWDFLEKMIFALISPLTQYKTNHFTIWTFLFTRPPFILQAERVEM